MSKAKDRLVLQKTNSDCGLASVSMICEVPYFNVFLLFHKLGLYAKHHKNSPYATNYKDVKLMLSSLGFEGKVKKFKSWDEITIPSIIKVPGRNKRNFHWVVAIPSQEHGLIIYNPSVDILGYEKNVPFNEMYWLLDSYEPCGSYIACAKI